MQTLMAPKEPLRWSLESEARREEPSQSRLAVIDLDDTLLGPDKKISPANVEALQRLRAEGFEIIVASGRHHQNIVRFQDTVGPMSWIISSGGAVLRHAQSNEILQEITVPETETRKLYSAGRALGLSVIVYHRLGVFMERESEWTRLYTDVAGWTPQIGNLSLLAASEVQKVILLQSGPVMAGVRAEFDQKYGERLYVVETQPELLEFLSPRANKALAAQTLARELQINQSDVIAFGDGNNDIEILSWAGFSVAMAHGRPGAHRAATRISPVGLAETAFARSVDLVLSR